MTEKLDDMTIAQLQNYIESKKKEKADLEGEADLPKKKKVSFSKKIVILVILMNILFTIAIMYLFLKIGNEPMALIGAWFGFTTVELFSLSKIKRAEIKEEENGRRIS